MTVRRKGVDTVVVVAVMVVVGLLLNWQRSDRFGFRDNRCPERITARGERVPSGNSQCIAAAVAAESCAAAAAAAAPSRVSNVTVGTIGAVRVQRRPSHGGFGLVARGRERLRG